MAKPRELKPEELAWKCDHSLFKFKTTADIEPLEKVVGQERAVRSLDFGLGLTNDGYNVFVLGESGTGKSSTVNATIERKAKDEAVPDDWCYVYNFSDPDRPDALSLPPGKGQVLHGDMYDLVETLKRDIPKVFESKDYERHRDEIMEGQQERTKSVFYGLEQQCLEKGFMLKKSVSGLSVVPEKDGKVVSDEEFDKLPKAKKAEMEEIQRTLQDRLSDVIREARVIEKETKERVNVLDREVVQYVVAPLLNDLLERFAPFDKVVEYLEDVKEDILESIEDFRPGEEAIISIPGLKMPKNEPSLERYQVNLLVNNKNTEGAPVVVEENPTYYNLFGHTEHKVQYGLAMTDFTMIKAGAVHRANGGYLVLNAIDVLRNIFVYDAIKRMIKTGEARIEDVWEQYRQISTMTLKPGPIPVKIKIIMIGEPRLYYLLYNLDREYRKLFKVKADFENSMKRTDDNLRFYAEFVAARCAERDLLPFDPSGVARTVEYALRLSADKEKLTARFSEVENIILEASYWAGVEGREVVTGEDVERAWRETVYRNSKIEDRYREYITEDTIMVDTDGAATGQVNGLAVLDFGDYAFGKPSRITARTSMGDSGVINIEREAKMSGRIHTKAHIILSSFLGERFGRDFPITLSASICFEQLYDGIEGDSATCAEFYALMSSIADVEIDQGIAVTGSMNQKGEVQPIGGVNEKIEGFFDVCEAKGLSGKQGVIIPSRNVKNLMLKSEVVEAVKEGRFAVYPIERVDEGLAILTGKDVGERGEDGKYPAGTVNRLVEDKLLSMAKRYKEFGRPKPAKKAAKKDEENNNNGNSKDGKDR